jgi:hypothetical protein
MPVRNKEGPGLPPISERDKHNIYFIGDIKKRWTGKEFKRVCEFEKCESYSKRPSNYCITHENKGKRVYCKFENCENYVIKYDFCEEHRPKITKICKVEECKNHTVKNGFCRCHGKLCNYNECNNVLFGLNKYCRKHSKYEEVIIKNNIYKNCNYKDCENKVKDNVRIKYCETHYNGKLVCNVEDCESSVCKNSQKCYIHGGREICKIKDCDKIVINPIKLGLCQEHGGGTKCTTCTINYGHNPLYKPLCRLCWCNKNGVPPSNFKNKELHFHKFINSIIPEDIKYRHDLQIDGGCSGKRPDWFIDVITHSVIIECDEHQHKGNSKSCEISRMNEIFTDLGDRPIVFIRFNPDDYINNEIKIPSCFIKEKFKLKDGTESIKLRKYKTEFEKRCKKLEKLISDSINTIPNKLFNVKYLFYNSL